MATGERKIMTTLALDGDAAFKKSMSEAYNALKVLGSEMKLNTSIFGENENSVESLTKKNDIMRKQIAQQKEIVTALTNAVKESATAYGETDKKTDSYRIKLNNATASLNNMENELSQSEKAINEVGDEIKTTEKKTVDWTAALKKTGDVLGKAVTVAAKTTAAAIVAVGVAAAAAAKYIYNAAVSAGTFADDLITLSNQTSISTDTLQKWTYAARFIDTEVETMTGSMAKMVRQMDAASNGTKLSADAFKQLNIDIQNSDGTLRDSETVFLEAIDALGMIANETERDSIAMQIFGKSAQDLNPLIIAGSDELRRLGEEAAATGLVLDGAALGALGNFDDTMEKIDAQTNALTNTLGLIFLPAVSAVMTGLQDLLTNIGTTLKDGFQPEDITVIGDTIAQKLIEGMQKITDYLPGILETVASMMSSILETVVSILPTLLPALMDAATGLINSLLTAIAENTDSLSATVVSLVSSFVTFLADNLPVVVTAGASILTSLASGISDAVPNLVPVAVTGLLTFVKTIIANLPAVAKSGMEMVLSIVSGISRSTPQIVAAVPGIIQALIETITSNLGLILTMGVKIVLSLISGIISAIPNMIANIPKVTGAIINGIGDAIGEIFNVGVDIVEGLWDGISSAAEWLWEQIAGWMGGLWKDIKGFFGISSPSKLMADTIGKPMAQGIAKGFIDNAGLISGAMDGLIPSGRLTNVAMNVTRRFNDVSGNALSASEKTTFTTELSDSAINRIVSGFKAALSEQGESVIVMNERELGRAVRKAVLV